MSDLPEYKFPMRAIRKNIIVMKMAENKPEDSEIANLPVDSTPWLVISVGNWVTNCKDGDFVLWNGSGPHIVVAGIDYACITEEELLCVLTKDG